MYTIEKNEKDDYYVAERKWYCFFLFPEYIFVNLKTNATWSVSREELHNIVPYKDYEEATKAINFLKERKRKEPLRIVLFDFT